MPDLQNGKINKNWPPLSSIFSYEHLTADHKEYNHDLGCIRWTCHVLID